MNAPLRVPLYSPSTTLFPRGNTSSLLFIHSFFAIGPVYPSFCFSFCLETCITVVERGENAFHHPARLSNYELNARLTGTRAAPRKLFPACLCIQRIHTNVPRVQPNYSLTPAGITCRSCLDRKGGTRETGVERGTRGSFWLEGLWTGWRQVYLSTPSSRPTLLRAVPEWLNGGCETRGASENEDTGDRGTNMKIRRDR